MRCVTWRIIIHSLSPVAADSRTATSFLLVQNMLKDPHLSRFVADATDPHALRFALWLEQQMTGARVWDADRAERAKCPVHRTVGSGHNTFVHVVHDRTSAHVAAWYSTKRPPAEQGRRFKLYDTRLWMRLHFMASRQAGLLENKEFADFYASFIGEFAGVYEITAPPFAREDMAWSESSERIEAYLAAGRRMPDLKPYAPGSR